MAGLSDSEAVRNLQEMVGPIPDDKAQLKRLRAAADVLLDRLDSQPVREAYREAVTPEGQA